MYLYSLKSQHKCYSTVLRGQLKGLNVGHRSAKNFHQILSLNENKWKMKAGSPDCIVRSSEPLPLLRRLRVHTQTFPVFMYGCDKALLWLCAPWETASAPSSNISAKKIKRRENSKFPEKRIDWRRKSNPYRVHTVHLCHCSHIYDQPNTRCVERFIKIK